jgi:hypothetical protein
MKGADRAFVNAAAMQFVDCIDKPFVWGQSLPGDLKIAVANRGRAN